MINKLGYTVDDSEQNAGNTYASVKYESTIDGEFALFRQDGVLDENGHHNGQADRYCQYLAEIEFAGVDNWVLAQQGVYLDLYEERGDLSFYGWPIEKKYWTHTGLFDNETRDLVSYAAVGTARSL